MAMLYQCSWPTWVLFWEGDSRPVLILGFSRVLVKSVTGSLSSLLICATVLSGRIAWSEFLSCLKSMLPKWSIAETTKKKRAGECRTMNFLYFECPPPLLPPLYTCIYSKIKILLYTYLYTCTTMEIVVSVCWSHVQWLDWSSWSGDEKAENTVMCVYTYMYIQCIHNTCMMYIHIQLLDTPNTQVISRIWLCIMYIHCTCTCAYTSTYTCTCIIIHTYKYILKHHLCNMYTSYITPTWAKTDITDRGKV